MEPLYEASHIRVFCEVARRRFLDAYHSLYKNPIEEL